MGAIFGCFRGNNSEEMQNAHCLCLPWSAFVDTCTSLFQRGDPEQRRIAPLPGQGTNPSSAALAQSNTNLGMDTYRSPPAPLAFDDPRCSHGQLRRSKSSPGSHEKILLMSSSTIKIGLNETMTEEKCFCSSVEKVVDDEVKNEVQVAEDSYSSSEDEDCPICLEEYTEENPKMLLQCNHDFHLSCIYEWMERSQSCPVCAKVMLFSENA